MNLYLNFLFVFFCLSITGEKNSFVISAKPACYYIDSKAGNDNNNGKSESKAWKTLSRLTHTKLEPGDSIRFKRGSSFVGPLWIFSSGLKDRYITITDYGNSTDAAPSFTNPFFEQDNFGNCIRIKGSYVIVENLYFHNTAAFKTGTYQTDGWNTWEMGAVYIDKGAQHCIVRNNEFFDCVVGVKSYGQHALIEHNYIHDCNRVLAMWNWGPIGIWLGADYQEVRYNDIINISAVHPNYKWRNGTGGADGSAIEIDDARIDKSNISIHHNYSRECQGFLEVTGSDIIKGAKYSNFKIHHNVSDDYQQFVALWRGANCKIQNNTIIRRRRNACDWGVFNMTQPDGNNLIQDNIIIVEKNIPVYKFGFERDKSKPLPIIRNNLYYAVSGVLDFSKQGPGNSPVFGNPHFLNYENGSKAADFNITHGSAAINKALSRDFKFDFISTVIPQDSIPDIGAFEYNQHASNGTKKQQSPLTYYIDSKSGNDNNIGTTKAKAWKSFNHLDTLALNPGDTIRFKRGSTFQRQLTIHSSGLPDKKITLSDYGSHELPAPAFTNKTFEQGDFGNCIRIRGNNIVVENLLFQHTASYVEGDYITDGWKEWEMGALYIDKGVVNCHIRNNEFFDCVAGIRSYGIHVLIEYNYLHDCNRPLRKWNWGPIGIWLGNDHQEVRYNRIINIRGENPNYLADGADGGAIEIDDERYDKTNISIHHNFTRDCQGFLEVVLDDVLKNKKPVYKNFNISYNVCDDYSAFCKIRGAVNCSIDNNTVIRRKKNSNEKGILVFKGFNTLNKVRNNIFATTTGVPVYTSYNKPGTIIQNNLYFSLGKLQMGNEGPGDAWLITDPLFVNASNANQAEDFSLKPQSPAIDKGKALGYLFDFLKGQVPKGKGTDLGAFEIK